MKKTVQLTLSSFFIAAIIYTTLWFYIGSQIKNEAIDFYQNAEKDFGYTFHGKEPKLSGFPLKPTISYKEGFEKNGVNITFKKLTVTAIPIPFQPLDIHIQDLKFQTRKDKKIHSIDNVTAQMIIPKSLPEKFSKNHLTSWQKEVGNIKIRSLELNKNAMKTIARGTIGLGQNLQPTLNLTTQITEYEKLIDFMSNETDEINQLQATIARGVLNSLSTTDKSTGQKTVSIDIIIKNRKLSLGPVRTIKFPKVNWPNE